MNVATQIAVMNSTRSTKTKECIVVEGKKYCESSEFGIAYLGLTLLIAVLFFFWLVASFYLFEEKNSPKAAAFLLLAVPSLIIIIGVLI